MMIRKLLLPALGISATLLPTPVQSAMPAPHRCNGGVALAGKSPGGTHLRRLDQLPPAAEILTVMRIEGGCQRPVVVRYGIGGNPRAVGGTQEGSAMPPSWSR